MKPYLIAISMMLFSIKVSANTAIAVAPEQVTPLLNGLTIPAVTLTDAQGKTVPLAALVKQKPSVLVF